MKKTCALPMSARSGHHRAMKAWVALALFALAVAAMAALVSGAGGLEALLPGGLPVGNGVAALGVVALACVPVLLSVRGSRLRRVSLALLAGAAAWLPGSIVLAGNLALNFSGWRGAVWLGASVLLHGAAWCVLAWALLARLAGLRRRPGTS